MNVRREALSALTDIIENGAYANLRLKSCERNAAVHALVLTTLEHLYYIDFLLAQYTKRQKRVVRNILRLASAELLYMSEPPYAVINEAVSLCKLEGKQDSAPLVNAVLRRIAREMHTPPPLPGDEAERLSILHSCPVWIIRLWAAERGMETARALLEAPATGMEIRAQHPYTAMQLAQELRVPYQRGSVDDNCFRLTGGMDVGSCPLFSDGSITVQNQGSMAICRALGTVRGKSVLDACAAPGGKSAYLYSLEQGDLSLTAWELHPHRKQLLDATLSRLHVRAETACKDATVYDDAYRERFDAVLVDAPCSGLGLLRDKVDIRYNRKEEDMPALAALQSDILDACWRYVKIGGLLMYATCTISRKENEEQARRFLSRHAEFSLEDERQFLPTSDGIDGFYYARMMRCS